MLTREEFEQAANRLSQWLAMVRVNMNDDTECQLDQELLTHLNQEMRAFASAYELWFRRKVLIAELKLRALQDKQQGV